MLESFKECVSAPISPMCGNLFCQDRRFLMRRIPTLECFPLPQCGCEHVQGTVEALEAGNRRRAEKMCGKYEVLAEIACWPTFVGSSRG